MNPFKIFTTESLFDLGSLEIAIPKNTLKKRICNIFPVTKLSIGLVGIIPKIVSQNPGIYPLSAYCDTPSKNSLGKELLLKPTPGLNTSPNINPITTATAVVPK